ncbi:MAG: PrpF family protein, partial [SAR324 cluster bacterium]|nr:PrpF family protein [SAR324 cluster bacterium]
MSAQLKFPAIYMRGGTSRGVFFHRKHLPAERRDWDALFLQVIGSPDPYGRQLNGLGVGVSSLSKAVVIGPSEHPQADVDYTFAQIGVGEATVDYSGLCGNLTSAVGPFAVDEGLVEASGGEALVRIHNTNTHKLIHARFPLVDGQAAVEGDFVLAGVHGTGARIRLEFKQPGGSKTGALLPSGRPVNCLAVPGLGEVEVSLVDASNPVVIVRASDMGVSGVELPEALERDGQLKRRLEAVRAAGAVAMGMAASARQATRDLKMVPFVAMVAPPQDAETLSGERLGLDDVDLTARVISNGQAHRAVPLTAGMCLAVAARIEGSLAQQAARPPHGAAGDLRLAHPSGVLPVAATVTRDDGGWTA